MRRIGPNKCSESHYLTGAKHDEAVGRPLGIAGADSPGDAPRWMLCPEDEGASDGHVKDFQADKKKQLIEVTVFLLLIVPSLILSLFFGQHQGVDFPLVATSVILRDLALLSLALYFVWSNYEPVRRIGLAARNIRREILVGIALYLPFLFLMTLIEAALLKAGFSAPERTIPSFLLPKTAPEYILAFFLVTVVAVSEEAIFRGYLILRFANVTGSLSFSVILSTLIFSLGHGYEGSAGVVAVGIMGFLFAIIYLWRMSLIAPIVMHFLQDFIGIILIPLLRR
jgi:membrane protease YdiL (CAAX protease family)